MTFVPSKPPHPMLARPGKLEQVATAVQDGYLVEQKIDGVRCMVVCDNNGVHLYNRQLRDITAAFPEVCDELHKRVHSHAMLGRLVLDGEVYCRDEAGRVDFQLVQTRANRLVDVAATAARCPARFAAFDVLSSGHVDYTRQPLEYRRRVLAEIVPTMTVATYTQDEANAAVSRRDGEGLMLKHLSSKYEPGARSLSWLKVKYLREVECYVGGVTHGIGKREDFFGALLVGVYRPGDAHGVARLNYIGTVGTGFTDVTLDALTLHLGYMRTATNPFVELGTDWDLKHYVIPSMRIKVRFQDYTRGGIMRFPRFVGLAE